MRVLLTNLGAAEGRNIGMRQKKTEGLELHKGRKRKVSKCVGM